MTFSSLKSKHRGEEAWVFTKGPSFDDFDISIAGDLVIGINETVEKLPSPLYCVSFWADGTKVNIPDGCVHLNGKDESGRNIVRRPSPQNCVGATANHFVPGEVPLFFQYSTMILAMSYLAYMGVSSVHVIGVDPEEKYSEQFNWGGGDLTEDQLKVRRQTKNLMIDMAYKAGMEIYDWGRN